MAREKGLGKFNEIVSEVFQNTGGEIGQWIIATFETIKSILPLYKRMLEFQDQTTDRAGRRQQPPLGRKTQ
jgi:hypothetical protein